MKLNDLTGHRFGRLVVLREGARSADGHRLWQCVCDCGTEKSISGATLLRSKRPTRSCGCLMKETISACNTRHGLSLTPTWLIWCGMKTRCLNKRDKSYAAYGGRGIRMCSAIQESVETIIGLIGARPENKTIDRVNNTGHYSCGKCPECAREGWPMNIRWATLVEQGRNQSTNHHVEINGVTRCLSEWAEVSGLKAGTINARINRGWPSDRLLDKASAKPPGE